MSTAELKNLIINKLSQINDEALLNDISRLIQMESDIKAVYKLSNDEKDAVELAFQDVDAGKTYSSSSANQFLKEWLKK